MKLLPPPGPARTRQLLALAGTGFVAAFALWWAFGSSAPAPAPAVTPAGAAAAAQAAAAAGKKVSAGALPAPVKLTALEPPDDPAQTAADRNPFRFGQPPAPPQPKYVPPPPAPPPPPPGPPPIPDVPLQLIALATLPGNVRTATLRDTGTSTLVIGQEGQVLDGRYRLVKIGLESVIVSYLDGSGRRTLALR